MTRVAILGQGNMGKGLAKLLAGKVELALGAREPKAGEVSYAEAVDGADIVVLALPYAAALEVAGSLNLHDKVVLDITNPVTQDYMNLTLGYTTSAAEEIQKAATGARVVKGFNTVFATLLDLPAAEIAKAPVFIAGDDEAANQAVATLSKAAGFKVEPSGALEASRLLEPLGVFNIRMAYALGKGTLLTPDWVILAK